MLGESWKNVMEVEEELQDLEDQSKAEGRSKWRICAELEAPALGLPQLSSRV